MLTATPTATLDTSFLLSPKDTSAVYNISLFVTDCSNGLTAEASTVLTVTRRITPVDQFSLTPLDAKYNVDKKISVNCRLRGTAGLEHDTYYTYWEVSPSLDNSILEAALLAPVAQRHQVGLVSYSQLILRPYSLRAGATYLFRLRASFESFTFDRSPSNNSTSVAASQDSVFIESFVQFTISTNKPPQAGVILVDPKHGVALNTSFFLSAAAWVDHPEDYPLTYSFAYYVENSNQLYPVKARNTISNIRSTLGQGLYDRYVVMCVVYVTDSLGATANATQQVRVVPLADKGRVVAAVALQVAQAMRAADSQALSAIVGTAALAINSALCIGAVLCCIPCTLLSCLVA